MNEEPEPITERENHDMTEEEVLEYTDYDSLPDTMRSW